MEVFDKDKFSVKLTVNIGTENEASRVSLFASQQEAQEHFDMLKQFHAGDTAKIEKDF